MRGPIFTNVGEDIERSSLLKKFVSELRYLAAFSNVGGSKLNDVENDSNFALFDLL